MRSMLEKIKSNGFLSVSFLYILSSFVVKGISFITTPIFTRLMGTADFGMVSNFTTWEQVLATFVCLQVSSTLLPAKVNHAPNRFDSYMKSIVSFALICAVAESSILLLLCNPIGKATKLGAGYIPLLCIAGFGVAASNICSAYYIATNRPKQKVAFSIISSLVTVTLGLLFVYCLSNKSQGRILGYTTAYAVIILFCLFKFLRYPLSSKDVVKGDLRYALAFGIPLIPHLLANLINGSADRIFIINICGESQNGIYSVAYSVGQLSLVFASACSDAWNPWYFKESKKNTDISRDEIKKYYIFYTVTIAMCFVGVMLLAPEIFMLMAPKEYWSGIPCVLFVALGIFFLFIYRFPLAYEQLNSNTKYVAPATIIAAVVNLLLNSLLIPKIGINGAAIATTVSYIVLWIVHEIVSRVVIRGYNIPIRISIYSILLVIGAFALGLFFINASVILRGLILISFCISYLIYVIKSLFSKGDR